MRLLEVKLKEKHDFQIVMETLRRIGTTHELAPNTLHQEVYILHKTGKYFLLHHTELLTLDGKLDKFSETGIGVRNTVATLLENWNLLKIVRPEWAETPRAAMKDIIVVPHRDKAKWQFKPSYEIGKERSQ